MTEQTNIRLWSMRLAFAFLVCLILFFHLLPLEVSSRHWVGPDLILLFACAWSLRRPEYVPSYLLAFLFLIVDFLLFRPPGLWAALALIGCEHLKSRAGGLRDGGFINEWLAVCVVIALIAGSYRAILLITVVQLPSFGLAVFELIVTMLFYPVAVGVTHFFLGVRKASRAELDANGGKA